MIISFAIVGLWGLESGCRHPNHDPTFNIYSQNAGRPWLKRLDDVPDAAETQILRLDSRIEQMLY